MNSWVDLEPDLRTGRLVRVLPGVKQRLRARMRAISLEPSLTDPRAAEGISAADLVPMRSLYPFVRWPIAQT